MESKNVWQQIWEEIFGEQILLNEIFFMGGGGGGGGGGGQNGEQFHFKANFLEKKFLGPSSKFWRRDSCEEEISPAKIFWRIFVSKISL